MGQNTRTDFIVNDEDSSLLFTASGKHCLADFFGCVHLDDLDFIERALISSAEASGATILETKLHKFGGDGGVTGVLLLAESHMSIHTWPEKNYAAIDVFMCGDCDIDGAIEKLKLCFKPQSVSIQTHIRGGI